MSNRYRKLMHETVYRAVQMCMAVYKRWLDAEFQPAVQAQDQPQQPSLDHPVSEKESA